MSNPIETAKAAANYQSLFEGMAKKLGEGGRNRGSKYAYQVWADWSSEEDAK